MTFQFLRVSVVVGQSINDANQIGGTMSQGGTGQPGFVYGEGGPVYQVGAYGGYYVNIYGINNSTFTSVGSASTLAGSEAAFVISGGNIINPVGSSNALASSANAINNQGLVVGGAIFAFGSDTRAFSWDNGQLHWLDTGTNSVAYGVASNGLITGSMGNPGGSGTVAFLSPGGSVTSLGRLAGTSSATGYGVNSSGQVVGESGTSAFLYSDGVMMNLNDLIVGTTSLDLRTALAINNNGQILAQGVVGSNRHTYLLDPYVASDPGNADAPEPSTLLLIGSGLVALRLRRR